jgi:outer membrane protein assembly factor BamB
LALIELDLAAPPARPPASVPPVHQYRTSGLILSVVLLLALGGAAAPDALRWRYVGAVPSAAIPESPFQLDDDWVYTAGGSGVRRTVSAWQLAQPPVKRWSVVFPARLVGPDQVVYGDVRAQRVDDTVLITDGPDSTAVDAATGAVKWHLDIGVHPMPGGRAGLVEDPQFRPYTVYDQDGGAPGEIFFSATGVPHDEPPVKTDLRGVDLRTGATRWSAEAAGSIAAFDAAEGLVVLEAGRLTLRSAETGAVLRTAALPRIEGQAPESGRLAGDLVLISYGASDSTSRRLVAYSVRSFQPVWQVPEARVLTDPGVCIEVVCADDKAGVSVLDPATGRTLWHAPGLNLIRFGGDVLEAGTGTTDPVRLADPRNGDERLRLTGWHNDLSLADDAPLVLRRSDDVRASTFAVIDDGPVQLVPLGTSHGPVADCAANDRFVVCRGTGSLQVFAYRG